MPNLADHLRRQPLTALALFAVAASMLALAGAFISQYGFGLFPCQMCYWQRIPYAVVILLGMLALFAARRDPGVSALMLWLCALAFVVGAGLGLYHAGVEWQWWAGPGACAGVSLAELTLEQIQERLFSAPAVSCSEAAFRFLGLSMAGWNALYSGALFVAMVYGLRLPRPAKGAA